MNPRGSSLIASLRRMRQFIPNGFRDEDGVWHDGPHQIEFDRVVSALEKELNVVNPCKCGHDHVADEDGADAGCRVCECGTWTAVDWDADYEQRMAG